MIWHIEVKNKKSIPDSAALGIKKDIVDLGFSQVSDLELVLVYNLEGNLKENEVKRICEELLSNPLVQEFSFSANPQNIHQSTSQLRVVEIAYNPGVMDPVEHSTLKGIRDLGIKTDCSIRTAKKYFLYGSFTDGQVDTIVNRVLANKLIQHVVDYHSVSLRGAFFATKQSHKKIASQKALAMTPNVEVSNIKVVIVDLLGLNDRQLIALSQKGQLFLNVNEMKAIQAHFKSLKRNPTDCELETIAQTWSEHCYHKTFRGNINYQYTEKGKKKKKFIKNLLKETIMKATFEIDKPWCISVFHDNAGVIAFDKEDHLCFKVETHNHPSALEPFGGANTGLGGVIRDILGTGLAAKPICSTDVFCFAPPDLPQNKVPAGTLHPKRVMKGVVAGVKDYGNKMGIPTVNGAILFDEGFISNPLVYCGTVGLLPKGKVKKKALKGDRIVVVGGRTGRDGIHGATFSSGELTDESEVVSSGAVQIGNPIEEKKTLDGILKARDLNLFTFVTDCGAGGLSSAVGEMGKDLGAKVILDNVPLKYAGLNYEEIWISESQERMVLAVSPQNVPALIDIFKNENVEAAVIGEFTGKKRLEIFYKDCQVCDLDMGFLHDGLPRITKEAVWAQPKLSQPRIKESSNLNAKLLEVLSHYNVCSKEWVIRQYDHEVQGMSVVKPLVGIATDGPSDASVIAPKYGSKKGFAVSNGINFLYGKIDPFWMAASCIDEAIRQVIAVGGSLDHIAILDNFCWGNPDKPDRLGGLVRCSEGCYKTAVGYQVPFISGKDSLYNEYSLNNKSTAIPGTILISAIGIMNDVTKAVTMDLKAAGNLVYVVGETYDELGGSIYLDTFNQLGNSVPKVDMKKGVKIFNALSNATKNGLIASMHDCSEGGLAVSFAEMAFSGNLGLEIDLKKIPYRSEEKRGDYILFSESNSRFVVEVDPKDQKRFEKILKSVSFALVGKVVSDTRLIVNGLNGKKCLDVRIAELKESWQKSLRW